MWTLLVACSTPSAPEAHPPGGHPTGEPSAGGHRDHATMNHRFDDAEKWAKVFDDPARDAWQKPAELVAALELAPGSTVADVGAGTGYFEPHLAASVGPTGKVLAIDVEPTLIEHLRARGAREGWATVEPRLGAVDDPGLHRGEVDAVLLVDVYHHIDGRVEWFRRLAPALRPGGRLIVVDFDPASDDDHGPPRDHRLPPDVVERELAEAGWTLAASPAVLPHQYVRVFRP